MKEWLINRAEEGERWHQISKSIELPSLLISVDDFTCFERLKTQPNFVTDELVVADSIVLSDGYEVPLRLKGAIVLIERADPGFDWLFGQDISGLVTMFGGANSHMAVRAAEFNLPSAIGIGESLYERLSSANVIEMDCSNNWLRIIA